MVVMGPAMMQQSLYIKGFNMKNKIKKIVSCIIFLCIIYIIFLKITYLFSETGYNRLNIVGIKEEEPLDVIYVGASAAFVYWQPLKAWNDCGFTSYSYATVGLPAESIQHYIEEVLKTQAPELIVIDARPFQLWSEEVDAKIRYGSDSMSYSLNRFSLVKDYFDSRTVTEDVDVLSHYLQIIKYHTNYQDVLSNEENWRMINNRGISEYKGWTFMEYHCPLEEPKDFETDQCIELAEGSRKILDKLLVYCKEKELKVLFVVSPYSITKEEQKVYNEIQKIVENEGFDFLNANLYYDKMGLDFQTDFNDYNHVNCFGAEKYTCFLEEYLMEKYSLPDHRGKEEYASWDELYIKFKEDEVITKSNMQKIIDKKRQGEKAAELLPTIEDPMQWVVLADNDNFTALISTVGEWKSDSMDFGAILSQFGICDGEDNYFLKVISGQDDTLVDIKSADNIREVCDIGEDGIRQGQSHVEIASGEKGYLSIDDVEYVFDEDGVYIGIYNNNTNQLVDLVKIEGQNDRVHLKHYDCEIYIINGVISCIE